MTTEKPSRVPLPPFFEYCTKSILDNRKGDLESINKRTKVVCSIGPKCSSVEILSDLLKAGVDVFRLNFSFGDHDSMRTYANNIREGTSHPITNLIKF